LTWSKVAVVWVNRAWAAPPSAFWSTVRSPGEVTNRPTWTVAGSPARVAVPIVVHRSPSVDSYPVTRSPARVSRSQRGDPVETTPGRPGVSSVKLYCIRTPWLPVSITAAYAEPGRVLSLIMMPAFAHGTRPVMIWLWLGGG
jgi:hypothetical protein